MDSSMLESDDYYYDDASMPLSPQLQPVNIRYGPSPDIYEDQVSLGSDMAQPCPSMFEAIFRI